MKIFNQFIVAVLILFSINSINAATKHQEVYIADEPLPIIAAKLEEQGLSRGSVISHLKTTLQKITPKLAKEKYDIKLQENNFSEDYLLAIKKMLKDELKLPNVPNVYPAVAICYMEKKVGNGLFAMEDIKKGDIIAEYVGEYKYSVNGVKPESTDYSAIADNSPDTFTIIDAKYQGSAARFAQYLLTEEALSAYGYEWLDKSNPKKELKNDIAIANSALMLTGTNTDKRLVLYATKNINAFEQIGFDYGVLYGYGSPGDPWAEDPCLFRKNGEVVPEQTYQIARRGLIFRDKISVDNTATVKPMFMNNETLEYVDKNVSLTIGNYKIIPVSSIVSTIYKNAYVSPLIVIVDNEEWTNKTSSPKSRLAIMGYFITDEENLNKIFAIKKHGISGVNSKDIDDVISSLKKDNYGKNNDGVMKEEV